MPREWVLETGADGSGVRLGLRNPQTREVAELVPPCGSMEELRKGVASVKAELDALLDQAPEKFETLRQGGSGAPSPEEVWKRMESCASEQEMFDYFNSLGPAAREGTSDYIFSHVNMFKGRGPVFSEHYDSDDKYLK
jgi:hypothetical protein